MIDNPGIFRHNTGRNLQGFSVNASKRNARMEYFDFDGTCSKLVNNPSTAYMDGNVAFAFAVKLACGDEFRFLTGRSKEDFASLLYNKGENVEEAPNSAEIRTAKLTSAQQRFSQFLKKNPKVAEAYPGIEEKVAFYMEGTNLADALAKKTRITDHGELLTVGEEDKALSADLKAAGLTLNDKNEILIPRTPEEEKQMEAYVASMHKDGREFIGKLCEKYGFETDESKATDNYLVVEYKMSSLAVNFNSTLNKEKAFAANTEVRAFMEESLKKAPPEMFSLEQEEAQPGSPPVFEIRSAASKGNALRAFGLLKNGINFYGDSFGKVVGHDENGGEIRKGGTDRSVGDTARKEGVKVNIFQVASSKDKEITNPNDSCAPRAIFTSPSDLGLYMQKDVMGRMLQKTQEKTNILQAVRKEVSR